MAKLPISILQRDQNQNLLFSDPLGDGFDRFHLAACFPGGFDFFQREQPDLPDPHLFFTNPRQHHRVVWGENDVSD